MISPAQHLLLVISTVKVGKCSMIIDQGAFGNHPPLLIRELHKVVLILFNLNNFKSMVMELNLGHIL